VVKPEYTYLSPSGTISKRDLPPPIDVERHRRVAGGLVTSTAASHTEATPAHMDLCRGGNSGLTYQATQLENAALFTREPSHDDDRGATMTLTPAGSALLDRVVPGHV